MSSAAHDEWRSPVVGHHVVVGRALEELEQTSARRAGGRTIGRADPVAPATATGAERRREWPVTSRPEALPLTRHKGTRASARRDRGHGRPP